MKHIVLAIDFEALTGAILEQGAGFAHRFGASLWLLHVQPSRRRPAEVGPDGVPLGRDEAIDPTIRQQLQAMTKELRIKDIRTEALCRRGPLVRTLFDYAEALPADLIIMGAHAGNPFTENGNLTRLVRQTAVPILFVPDPGT